MSALNCEACRAALFARVEGPPAAMPAAVAAHLDGCAACRTFAGALDAGLDTWRGEDAGAFADGILARTAVADALAVELRALAEMDPGPGFTERILRHTSQRPAPARWRAAWVAGWRALVRRPRFAWEVAYAATLCWFLVLGNPVAAWEWGTQKVGSVAQERLGPATAGLRDDLQAWRAGLTPDTPSSTPIAGPNDQGEPGPFERAYASASGWVRGRLAEVFDAFMAFWQSLADWIAGSDPSGATAPSTEPSAGAARSTQ